MTGTGFAIRLTIDFAVIAICIIGIWLFRNPKGARWGNLAAASAMLIAFGLVLWRHSIFDPVFVLVALLIGTGVGYAVARAVTMLQIPTMVALQNGMGGLASLLVALVELVRNTLTLGTMNQISGIVGLTLGALTFSGSMIAAAKLSAKIRQTPQLLPAHTFLVLLNLACMLIAGVAALLAPTGALIYLLMVQIVLAGTFGLLFSIRIGGADMPVLISFLNATTGLAAAFCGIVIESQLLIAFGATVAAAGSILTHAMCKAMNRSLLRVFVPHAVKPGHLKTANGGTMAVDVKAADEIFISDPTPVQDPHVTAAGLLKVARTVIIVPGYGMALAQAQREVAALAEKLGQMGKTVKYAIHPVAGRMPGHMNVLLAEAGVEYDMLAEMESVNPEFPTTDLALVVGACDVVNPAAIEKEGTPISGMPILMAHEAKSIIICNLDKKPGYSGVDNPLYENSKALLLLGDAKKTTADLIVALESFGQ